MGLDMYLMIGDRERVSTLLNQQEKFYPRNTDLEKEFENWYNAIDLELSEIAYWRKANAIHRWMVENVQGGEDECKYAIVNRDSVEELLSICELVNDNHSKAYELLPTESGFFFGSTRYDDWYFDDVEATITFLNNALEELDESTILVYHSSW